MGIITYLNELLSGNDAVTKQELNEKLYHVCWKNVYHGYSGENIEEAKSLFVAGADTNTKSSFAGYYAIEHAARHPHMLNLFLEEGGLSENALFTALKNACVHGIAESVQLLLKSGVSVNAHDQNGDYAIYYATSNPAVLKLFLEKNTTSKEALNSGLYSACNYGILESVKLLLKAGADVNAQNKYGSYAIEHATRNPAILELFIEKGGISKEAAMKTGLNIEYLDEASSENDASDIQDNSILVKQNDAEVEHSI